MCTLGSHVTFGNWGLRSSALCNTPNSLKFQLFLHFLNFFDPMDEIKSYLLNF